MNIKEIKDRLMEEQEKIDEFYTTWEMYETTEKIYYAIPTPKDIIKIYDNEIGYNKFTNPNDLEEYEEKLKYFKKVAEYYNDNDFVLDYKYTNALFNDNYKILDYYISPEVRRRVNGICKELEESIKKLRIESVYFYNRHEVNDSK